MPLFTPIGPAASPRTKPAPGTPAARALALAPSAPSALVPHTNGLTSKKPLSNDGQPDGLVAYQFARALEQMLVRQETRRLAGDGDAVMSDASPPSAGIPLELSLQLVTAYEAICEEVLREVEVGIPSDAGYREAVTKLYAERLAKVRAGGSVREIEDAIGEGQIEEMYEAAKDELALIPKMRAWKPWDFDHEIEIIEEPKENPYFAEAAKED